VIDGLPLLTPDARRVSIRARMPNQHQSERDRDHRPPLKVEVDHAIVVSLRPVARQRDVNLARLVRDLLDAIGEKPGLVGAILDSETSAEA
jgi:hypothetical protein